MWRKKRKSGALGTVMVIHPPMIWSSRQSTPESTSLFLLALDAEQNKRRHDETKLKRARKTFVTSLHTDKYVDFGMSRTGKWVPRYSTGMTTIFQYIPRVQYRNVGYWPISRTLVYSHLENIIIGYCLYPVRCQTGDRNEIELQYSNIGP